MSANGTEPTRAPTTEQTPLLRDADPANSASGEGQPEPEEPSTRELIIVLGAIWVGVFLAALGRVPCFQSLLISMANHQNWQIQPLSQRYLPPSRPPSTHFRYCHGLQPPI